MNKRNFRGCVIATSLALVIGLSAGCSHSDNTNGPKQTTADVMHAVDTNQNMPPQARMAVEQNMQHPVVNYQVPTKPAN